MQKIIVAVGLSSIAVVAVLCINFAISDRGRSATARIEIIDSRNYSPFYDSSAIWNEVVAYADTAISDTISCMKRENIVTIINVSDKPYQPSVYITITRGEIIIGSAVFPPERCFEIREDSRDSILVKLSGWKSLESPEKSNLTNRRMQ